jgi:hypothetical protein
MAMVVCIQQNSQGCDAAPEVRWGGSDEEWSLTIPAFGRHVTVGRRPGLLTVDQGDGVRSVTVGPGPDPSMAQATIRRAYADAAARYAVRFRDLVAYRVRATWLVLSLAVVMEAVFLTMKRWQGRGPCGVRALTLAGWLVITVWLAAVYLR